MHSQRLVFPQTVPRTYLANLLGLPLSLLHALTSPTLRPPPTPPRKRSIHPPILSLSSSLQELTPVDWIALDSLALCPRTAARLSAPLSSRRSTEPPQLERIRNSPPPSALPSSPIVSSSISVHLAVFRANAPLPGMTFLPPATASR
ncbi:hypothetical protein N7486_010325 [Penicillium sp. IBT 16267x]|nr:hypothetical protein N7486_010325 [Penicillium sp. IBT 16267x]